MGPFEIAAIAIIGAFIVKITTTWMKTNRGSVPPAKLQDLERRIQALEAQQNVKALEERVQVLEGIVTTEEFELQKKFRQLEE
jgi:hypothetical protein